MDRVLVVDSLPGEFADDWQFVPLAAVGFHARDNPNNYENEEDQKSQSQDHDPSEELHFNHVEHHRENHTKQPEHDSNYDLQASEKKRLDRVKLHEPVFLFGDGEDDGQHESETTDKVQDITEHRGEIRVHGHEARFAAGRA